MSAKARRISNACSVDYMEFSRSSPLQQITFYSSFFRPRGRRQRSFFDGGIVDISPRRCTKPRGQPRFVFFLPSFFSFLSFFLFFRTILPSASRSNIYGASFLLLLTMMRRGAPPPYPLRLKRLLESLCPPARAAIFFLFAFFSVNTYPTVK